MNPYYTTELATLYRGNCLEIHPSIPDQSIDFILTDLPYGVTACSWDVKLPLDELWREWKRIIKPRGAIALFGTQPFTSELVMSNREWFKYEWIWEKDQAPDFLNANKRPLKVHENILVFSESTTIYNPQKKTGAAYKSFRKGNDDTGNCYGEINKRTDTVNLGLRFPTSVINFQRQVGIHPTQKPIALLQYLIRTYTNEGGTVLDSTCGSGSTLVAAQQINRKAIGIELDPEYCAIAASRLGKLEPQLFQKEAERTGQLTIFGEATA